MRISYHTDPPYKSHSQPTVKSAEALCLRACRTESGILRNKNPNFPLYQGSGFIPSPTPPRGPGSLGCWPAGHTRTSQEGPKRSIHPPFFASWCHIASSCWLSSAKLPPSSFHNGSKTLQYRNLTPTWAKLVPTWLHLGPISTVKMVILCGSFFFSTFRRYAS